MIVRQTLKKKEILRGKKNFDLLFDRGERIRGTVTRCLVLSLSGDPLRIPIVTVAFVVPRTVKRAVDRIHIKRLLREAYRRNKHELFQQPSLQSIVLLFVCSHKPDAQHSLPSYNEIEIDMKFFLRVIREKSHA